MRKCIAALLLVCGLLWFVPVISYAADNRLLCFQ